MMELLRCHDQKVSSYCDYFTSFLIRQTFYAIEDPAFPGDPALIQRVQAEQAFCDAYFNRTGIRYRHYFGPEGPRPAPVLAMLPAAEVGDVHKITSYNGVW
jgi:hypothetical protein